jgi:tetratricopeptide (TPR) repeat protein
VLWLADLGVARARFSQEDDDGLVLGTIGYMAPERLTGQVPLWCAATDLFSVGAVLYRLVSGELPYPARDPVEALASRQRPPSHVPRRPGMVVPAGLDEIILNLLQPDRRSRYDLAADVARALSALRDPPNAELLTGGTSSMPPRMALLAQVGEDSLIEWPPPPAGQGRPSLASPARSGGGGIDWHKPAPLRPPRERPRPYLARRVPQEPRLIAHREIPVIGREEELDQLWRAARHVLRRRTPAIVHLHAARGLGRTRLVDEMTRTWERMGIAQGARLDYSGRAEQSQGLEGALRQLLPPLPDARSTRNDIARTLSRLRDSTPASCRYDAGALADWMSPRSSTEPADRSVVRSFLIEHLTAHAWRGFSWLWLEDLHLAGDADDAWPIIENLVAAELPVLILCSSADDPRHRLGMRPLRRMLARHASRTLKLQLGPLSLSDAQRLAQAHLPMDPPLAAAIAATTAGHPRFLHELIIELVQQGWLRPGRGSQQVELQWGLSDEAPPLPADARAFARQRLESAIAADPEIGHALRVVRLAGSGTPDRVLARVLGESLNRLLLRGLIREEREGLVIESPELKEAIDERDGTDERSRAIHEALAAAWQEEEEGGPVGQARAGLHLCLAGRATEGLPMLRQALRSLAGTMRPGALDRLAGRIMAFATEVEGAGSSTWTEAAMARSEALWTLGLLPEALSLDAQIAEQVADPSQAVQAACLHAGHLGPTTPGRNGLDRLDEVAALLDRVPSPVRAGYHAARASLHTRRQDRPGAEAEIDLALSFAPRPVVHARILLLRAELRADEAPAEAMATARQVQAIARQSGLLQAEVEAWDLLGRLAVREGQVEEAVAELEAGIVRLRRVGERIAAGQLLATLGRLLRESGDLDGARRAYLDALSLESTGQEPFARFARSGLALLAGMARDASALRLLVDANRQTLEPGEAAFWSMLRQLAEILDGGPRRPLDPRLAQAAAGASPDGRLAADLLQRELHPSG